MPLPAQSSLLYGAWESATALKRCGHTQGVAVGAASRVEHQPLTEHAYKHASDPELP